MQGMSLRKVTQSAVIEITVTGTGHESYCYLLLPDGTKVYSAGTYYIECGQIVSAYTKAARSSGGGTYGVTVVGTLVAVSGTTAKCAFTNNVTVTMSGNSTFGYLVAITNAA